MTKEFYPLGETPPLGKVPQLMLANCIRKSRFGEPKDALKIEKIPVPAELKPHEVLVYIMAAGVNYNVIWASSGVPVDVINYCNKKGYTKDFHIPGSDAAGVVMLYLMISNRLLTKNIHNIVYSIMKRLIA